VNGFILGGGGIKMSKSIGNVVDPLKIIDEYGTDALRYYLLREVSAFEDSSFTEEHFKEAYNANLANGIGNLTSRIMKMAETHLEEAVIIPEATIPQNWIDELEKFNIKNAADIVFNEIKSMDQHIQETKPFILVKTDREKGSAIIKELVIRLYTVARMLNPFMPQTMEKIKKAVKENKMPSEPLFLRKD
jgi:methionyl-tRNA synthetase